MVFKAAIFTVIGAGILVGPNWKPPFSQTDYFIQLLGWALMIGPGFLLLAAVVNHMLNISLNIDPKRRHK